MESMENTTGKFENNSDNEALHPIVDLRPGRFEDYIGQEQVVETLQIAVEAVRKRGDVLDHVLLYGPPGLGKTTMAHIIANELSVPLIHSSGPALEKGGDLVSILTHIEDGSVFFIDEIHRLPKVVEEFLYSAMEDFAVDIIFDKGMNARSYRAKLERFTLIGATTRAGLLSHPLRERFGIQRSLDFYSNEDIKKVILRSASILDVEIDDAAAMEIARRSRGTPRIANQLLRRVRDYAQVRADGRISRQVSIDALELEGIDEMGLNLLDVRFLSIITDFYKGGPVGLEAIAATMQEEPDTLIDVVEPYLLKAGLLVRTSSGRKVTSTAYEHLGKTVKNISGQLKLPEM